MIAVAVVRERPCQSPSFDSEHNAARLVSTSAPGRPCQGRAQDAPGRSGGGGARAPAAERREPSRPDRKGRQEGARRAAASRRAAVRCMPGRWRCCSSAAPASSPSSARHPPACRRRRMSGSGKAPLKAPPNFVALPRPPGGPGPPAGAWVSALHGCGRDGPARIVLSDPLWSAVLPGPVRLALPGPPERGSDPEPSTRSAKRGCRDLSESADRASRA